MGLMINAAKRSSSEGILRRLGRKGNAYLQARRFASDISDLFLDAWYKEFYFRRRSDRQKLLEEFIFRNAIWDIDPNPFFDSSWYRATYMSPEDVELPVVHYIRAGRHAGYWPNAMFDVPWLCAKLGLSGTELLSYFLTPAAATLSTGPYFDAEWYSVQHSAAEAYPGGISAYFYRVGRPRGDDPSAMFSSRWYLSQNQDVRDAKYPAFDHFLAHGAKEGRDPHPLFRTEFYLATNQDVSIDGIEPFYHFLTSGHNQNRQPHPLFDTRWYRDTYICGMLNVNPLSHYLGQAAEGTANPNPYFDNRWYVEQHETLRRDNISPLVHYVCEGALDGRDPSPHFDSIKYRSENKWTNAGVSPLEHFIVSGKGEHDLPKLPEEAHEARILDIPYRVCKSPDIQSGDKVCLFMVYSADGSIPVHVTFHMENLILCGYKMIALVNTEGLLEELRFHCNIEGLVVRRNHGWDFAAWALALSIWPELWRCSSLLLTNDSVFGPLAVNEYRTCVERAEWLAKSDADVVSLTDSWQVRYHLMSYFLVFGVRGLCDPQVQLFWFKVKSLMNKQAVIDNYEVYGLASIRGVTCRSLFPTDIENASMNPTLALWQDLQTRGCPLFKFQLLRDGFVPDVEDWLERFVHNSKLRVSVLSHLEKQHAKPFHIKRPSPARAPRARKDHKLKTFYGAVRGTRPHTSTDYALEVPFLYPEKCGWKRAKVAVIAHIFYPEMTEMLASYIAHIPGDPPVFISTDSVRKAHEIRASLNDSSVDVRVCENRGRDLLPLLRCFGDVISEYEIVLHVHSKRSPHGEEFGGWADFLLDNIAGSREIVESILDAMCNQNVGVVFSDHFPVVRPLINWGGNFALCRAILSNLGYQLSREWLLDFPSGSFFWIKSDVLAAIIEATNTMDFEAEAGQVDGTLAHAVERSILYAAEAVGYRWCKVATHNMPEASRLVPVTSRGSLDANLRECFPPLLGNSLVSPQKQLLLSEVCVTNVRFDAALRPRFNLVIPSLHSSHFFGGTSTALRVFDDIAAHLDGFDFRIICASHPMDMESMTRFPGWELVSFPQCGDRRRSIIDFVTDDRCLVDIRATDVFVATAWWTASVVEKCRRMQNQRWRVKHPLVYLIQDFEPYFYNWSSKYALSRSSYYSPDTIAIINSEELSAYLQRRCKFEMARTLRYSMSPQVKASVRDEAKERIILFYGRPSVPRNGFELVSTAISMWQQMEPEISDNWRIISVGEAYDQNNISFVENLTILGKLDLDEYGKLLSKSSIGISLMFSPHPSYPPLEMAYAGLITITNAFECKDLSLRSNNITSLQNVTIEGLVEAIQSAVRRVESREAASTALSKIEDLESPFPDFDPSEIAARIAASISGSRALC